MVKPVPSYLKLRNDESELAPPDVQAIPGLESLCQAFSCVTGWPMRFAPGPAVSDQIDTLWSAPVDPGVGASPGHLRIELGPTGDVAQLATRAPLEDAEALAAGIWELLQQTCTLRKTLWKREAELAAGVPVAARPDEPQHLASRLVAALKSGCQMLGCESAALYTLDEATTQLKLRSSWGLPLTRLEQEARPLATALADLEALLGHAVALESTPTCRPWNVPEACQSALCVPVSSPTMPLGTLWFFCDRPRDFTSDQTNLAEIIAGRLASELDRALLLHEQVQAVGLQRQLDEASRMQQQANCLTPPALDGWDLAGWTSQADPLGSSFHDWRMLRRDLLAIVVADAREGGVSGAILAAALRGALTAYLESIDDPLAITVRLDALLQTWGAGDQWAGMAVAVVDLSTGSFSLTSAGRPTALWLAAEGPKSLLEPLRPLGLGTQSLDRLRSGSEPITGRLAPGDALLLYNRGFVEANDEHGRPLDETAVSRALFEERGRSADELIEVLCDRQEAHAQRPNQFDRAAVSLKRRQ